MNDAFSENQRLAETEVQALVRKQRKRRLYKSTVLWILTGGALAGYLVLGFYYIWFRFFWEPDVDKALEKVFEASDSLMIEKAPAKEP